MEILSSTPIFFNCFVGCSGIPGVVFIFLLFPVSLTRDFRALPLIPDTPFLWAWNAPTEICEERFNEPIDLRFFSLVGSPQKDITGQRITIFYFDRLGLYPYIDNVTLTNVNGGIPQKGSLQNHLEKAKVDILYYMPEDKIGLAVIDWREWNPLWERNWKPKDIYQQRSIESVKQQNESLNDSEANILAKEYFEEAAKNFMKETLKLGTSLRPNYIWGYYLFPDCYNNLYNTQDYDGSCSDIEKNRNDELSWLWEESTALYPSIYLNSKLSSTPEATLYAQNRIQEAIRASRAHNTEDPLPIYIYTRPVFTDALGEYLPQTDLVSTIGEGVALGASGTIMWGSFNVSQSKQSCMDLETYMKSTLNPYLINVTLAAKMCSQVLCQEHGVCTRKSWNSSDYLHLNPEHFVIQSGEGGKYIVDGKPTLEDLRYFYENFHCSCYPHINCHETLDIQNIDIINVCVADDVCIEAFLGTEMNDLSSDLEDEVSENPTDVESYVNSVCEPGVDYHECLKLKCSMQEMFANGTDKECEGVNWQNVTSDLHFLHKKENKTQIPKNPASIKFPIYILHFGISYTFIYTSLASFSYFFI
ncbi:hyaluronidase PH-20-like [Erinaceus europaeus]|uniref:Hyaluronidase n=1 Tax=Erinaceus europaeus TaxID=9365 RepID=A0ABM3XSB1_ERIEU|nr:hyaluronidase PH-20-like [Erinaceus europaeus]